MMKEQSKLENICQSNLDIWNIKQKSFYKKLICLQLVINRKQCSTLYFFDLSKCYTLWYMSTVWDCRPFTHI